MAKDDEFPGARTASVEVMSPGAISSNDTSLLDAVDLPIIVIAHDCTIARINRAATMMLGVAASDVGHPLADTLAGVENLDKLCAQVMADGLACRREAHDGDRYFLLRIAPYTGSEHQILGAVLTFTNVTAFRASLDQAIYEREHTKAILNTVTDPLVVLDAKLQVQTANRAFYDLFGLSRNETQNLSILQLGNQEWETSRVWDSIRKTLSHDVQFQAVEIDREFPQIGSRTVVLNACRLAWEGHALILVTFQDVTKRKQAQRALSEQARLLDLSNDAISVRDAADQVTYWNKAATELYGFTREEASGRVIHELLRTQFPVPLETINQQLHRDERWNGELVHTTKDGAKVTVMSRWVLDRGADQNTWSILETNNDITLQERTEKALRESEERFRAIVETTPECVKLVSADGTLLHMNLPGLQMVGADSADQVIGKSIYDLVAQEDRDRYKVFNESVCGGEEGSIQFEIVSLKGERRHMETQAAPLRTSDGTIVHLAVTSDISERKQAERALRESEQRYRVITEAAPIMVWMSGLDKLCYYFNKGWLDFVGRTLEEETGNGWADGIHPDDLDRCLQIYVSSFEARRPFEMHYRLKHHSGQYRWILDHGVPRYGPDGAFEGYVGGCLDIHDQKEAEELLRRSEERFRALVHASSDVVYHMNPDWSEMGQLDGRGFVADASKPRRDWLNEYIHPDDQSLVMQAIQEAVRGKSMFQLEHRIRRADGSLGWTYSRAVPRLDVNGDIVEWFGAASDVTARKEAEEKYRKLAQTLEAEVHSRTRELEEQSNQVRELSWRLLRSQDEERRHIARELHDSVGQMLAALSMNLAAVQNQRLEAPVAQSLSMSTSFVDQITREIRTISHLLHPPLLEVAGLISAVRWYVDGFSERSQIKVDLDLPEHLPSLPDGMDISIFRLIQESLTNIHRHSGSSTARVTIREDPPELVVEIKDWGKGISPSRQAELSSGRMGVGFRGMRERLKQFGGKLEIHSDGDGTLVTGRMQLTPEPTPKPAATEISAQAS